MYPPGRKPFLLFATPRTGSWPIYYALLEHLEGAYGVQGLGEYFNTGDLSYWIESGEIVHSDFPSLTSSEERSRINASAGAVELMGMIRSRRYKWLKASAGRYFFKLFPIHLASSFKNDLAESHEWIFLERRDLFSQLLSYLISMNTGLWYEPKGFEIAPGSIRAAPRQVSGFEREIIAYQFHKASKSPQKVVYYEDFCQMSLKEFVGRLNLGGTAELTGRNLPSVQNRSDKGAAFQNLEEIREWYRQSTLNQLAPL